MLHCVVDVPGLPPRDIVELLVLLLNRLLCVDDPNMFLRSAGSNSRRQSVQCEMLRSIVRSLRYYAGANDSLAVDVLRGVLAPLLRAIRLNHLPVPTAEVALVLIEELCRSQESADWFLSSDDGLLVFIRDNFSARSPLSLTVVVDASVPNATRKALEQMIEKALVLPMLVEMVGKELAPSTTDEASAGRNLSPTVLKCLFTLRTLALAINSSVSPSAFKCAVDECPGGLKAFTALLEDTVSRRFASDHPRALLELLR